MENFPTFTPEQEEEIARFEQLSGDLEFVLYGFPYKTQFDVLTVTLSDLICSEHRNISDQKEEIGRLSKLLVNLIEKNKEDADMIDEFERQFEK